MKLLPIVRLVVGTIALTGGWITGVGTTPAVAQVVRTATLPNYTPAYQTIGRDTAVCSIVDVPLVAGRVTTIDFTGTDEQISHVLLADPSRAVYSLSGELGSAQTLFLRRIEPLDFPGATTSWVTNLSLQTVDRAGQQRLYSFNVVPVASSQFVGVAIVPAVAGQQTLMADDHRTITLDDIAAGLEVAIQRGYTSRTDPIVLQVQQLLATVRNHHISLVDAAATQGVAIEVLVELGTIAAQVRLLEPLSDGDVGD